MVRYVTVIAAVMFGFAGGLFGTYKIEPIPPQVLAEDTVEPLGYRIRGIIRYTDKETGAVYIDAVSRYSQVETVHFLIRTDANTVITDGTLPGSFDNLQANRPIMVTLTALEGILYAQSLEIFPPLPT